MGPVNPQPSNQCQGFNLSTNEVWNIEIEDDSGKEKTFPVCLTSHTNNPDLALTCFPFSSSENISHNTLFDSSTTCSFINKDLAEKCPKNLSKLENFKDTTCLVDKSIETVGFLLANLHPTVLIVLGLSWLKELTPEINWKDFTLTFQVREQNTVLLINSLGETVNWDPGEKQDLPVSDLKDESTGYKSRNGENIKKSAPSRLESLALQDEEERRGNTQSKLQDE